MSTQNNCLYCTKDEKLDDLMIEVTKLKVSTLYLFKEQTYRGRCIVAYDNHVNELFELEDEEIKLFMQDVAKVAATLKKVFKADKVNFGAYSDKLPHLHFHIVPKYIQGHTWGGTFEMMPENRILLKTNEYEDMIRLIKENL
jgi:Diadenosine tetraphosphate (Ap4A) hydrolase and other HIT family hydrolases